MFKEPDCNSQENRPQNRARLQHLAAVWLFLQSGSGFWLFLQLGYTTRVVGQGQRGCGGEPGEGRRHEDAGDFEARLRAYAAVGVDEGW